jgi:ATP-dependent RNA helicase DDX27
MEATKATNLIDHEAEILSRPKRSWFLTERQKAEIAEASNHARASSEPHEDSSAKQRAAKASKQERNAEAKGVSL